MATIAVYYKPQPDPTTFEKRYVEEHIPMVGSWDGVGSFNFAKVTNTIAGEFAYSHVFVCHFTSDEAMKAHLTSDNMKAAAKHAMEIAPAGFDAVMFDQVG